MRELSELDRIHLVLALQRHTSKAKLQQQARGGRPPHPLPAALLSGAAALDSDAAAGLVPGLHPVSFAASLPQEAGYVEDLMKAVSRAQHPQVSGSSTRRQQQRSAARADPAARPCRPPVHVLLSPLPPSAPQHNRLTKQQVHNAVIYQRLLQKFGETAVSQLCREREAAVRLSPPACWGVEGGAGSSSCGASHRPPRAAALTCAWRPSLARAPLQPRLPRIRPRCGS